MATFLIISMFILIATSKTPQEWEEYIKGIKE